MKLYDSQMAPNPRRVRIFLAEKGVTIPTEQVDIAGAVNRGDAFRQKNPLGGVPVLELDDGTCLAESVAICRYIEELHPSPPLLGTDARDRAIVEMWQRRMELEIFGPISQVFRNGHPFFAGRITQVPAWADACRTHAEASLAWLDRELADRAFVAGERYTIADITALCGIDFGRVSKIRIAPEHANLMRWHAAVSARPSAQV
jgi:glutathione S-transferase